MSEFNKPRLVDVNRAAEILGISPRHVWRLRARQVLPFIRLGRCTRFRVSDIDRLIEQGFDPLVTRPDTPSDPGKCGIPGVFTRPQDEEQTGSRRVFSCDDDHGAHKTYGGGTDHVKIPGVSMAAGPQGLRRQPGFPHGNGSAG